MTLVLLPLPSFDHLRRMTDGRGLFEHAKGFQPRYELGYCTDDVARALILTCLAEGPVDLRRVYLDFVIAAVAEDGRCHNRMSTDGDWTDEPGLGDWWGRAAWGLGVAVAAGVGGDVAESAFRRLAAQRSGFRRSMAYAALGAAAMGDRVPEARELLADAVVVVTAIDPGDRRPTADWPWPESRLGYDNALLPHALLAAGAALDRPDLVSLGLGWLEFLVRVQRSGGHLSVVPVGGWAPGESPPGFDQQPLELASLAAAGGKAHELTGDPRWLDLVAAAAAWFAGRNDSSVTMFDAETGAGYDGLTSTGRNFNAGAESTLAANLVLLLANRLGVTECPLSSSTTRGK